MCIELNRIQHHQPHWTISWAWRTSRRASNIGKYHHRNTLTMKSQANIKCSIGHSSPQMLQSSEVEAVAQPVCHCGIHTGNSFRSAKLVIDNATSTQSVVSASKFSVDEIPIFFLLSPNLMMMRTDNYNYNKAATATNAIWHNYISKQKKHSQLKMMTKIKFRCFSKQLRHRIKPEFFVLFFNQVVSIYTSMNWWKFYFKYSFGFFIAEIFQKFPKLTVLTTLWTRKCQISIFHNFSFSTTTWIAHIYTVALKAEDIPINESSFDLEKKERVS